MLDCINNARKEADIMHALDHMGDHGCISGLNGITHNNSPLPYCLKEKIHGAFIALEVETRGPISHTAPYQFAFEDKFDGESKNEWTHAKNSCQKTSLLYLGGATVLSIINALYHTLCAIVSVVASVLVFCFLLVTCYCLTEKVNITTVGGLLFNALLHINSVIRNILRAIPIIGFFLTKAFDVTEVLICNGLSALAHKIDTSYFGADYSPRNTSDHL